MLVSLTINSISPIKSRLAAVVVFFLLFAFKESNRMWKIEDWRGAIKSMSSELKGDKEVVFFYSGLIEAHEIGEGTNLGNEEYMKAPLSRYALNQTVIPIPNQLDKPSKKSFINRIVEPAISKTNTFYILSAYKKLVFDDGRKLDIADGYKEFFKNYNFTLKERKEYGLVDVLVFEK